MLNYYWYPYFTSLSRSPPPLGNTLLCNRPTRLNLRAVLLLRRPLQLLQLLVRRAALGK